MGSLSWCSGCLRFSAHSLGEGWVRIAADAILFFIVRGLYCLQPILIVYAIDIKILVHTSSISTSYITKQPLRRVSTTCTLLRKETIHPLLAAPLMLAYRPPSLDGGTALTTRNFENEYTSQKTLRCKRPLQRTQDPAAEYSADAHPRFTRPSFPALMILSQPAPIVVQD